MIYWRVLAPPPRDQLYWVHDDGTGPYLVRDNQGRQLHHPDGDDIPRSHGPNLDLSGRFGVGAKVVQSSHGQGEYHPRIWRPHAQPRTGQVYPHEWLDSVQAVRIILDRLSFVFRVLEPTTANCSAFGHELRHLLILACTEVESAWKSVLKANGYPTPKNNLWKTTDYVKLAKPLRLAEWGVSLTRTPRFPRITPFNGWDKQHPSTSLPWYGAYNKAKHDREGELALATLRSVVDAAAAAFIMVYAQFGQFGFQGVQGREFDVLQISAMPKWSLDEHYVPPDPKTGTWTPRNHTF